MSVCLVVLLQVSFTFAALFAVAAAFRRLGWDAVVSLSAAAAVMGAVSLAAVALSWACLPATRIQTGLAAYALLAVASLLCQAIARRQWEDEIIVPVAIGFAASLVLLIWAYAGRPMTADPLDIAAARWSHPLPDDNRLPLLLARALHAGVVSVGDHAPDMGDWLYSDRPPLQTAMFMLSPAYLIEGPDAWAYEGAAVSFQMLALVALWAFVRCFTAKAWIPVLATVVAFFTPLVIVNGLFVWPKLLAAAFLLWLAALCLSPKFAQLRRSPPLGALAGALAALAMLAHGGSAFGLIGILLTPALLGRVPPWRPALAFVLVAAALSSPWMAYQKVVNPPGDRLLKTHLAGVADLDPRPLGRTLLDSYGAKTPRELWDARVSNAQFLFNEEGDVLNNTQREIAALVRGKFEKAAAIVRMIRASQFFFFTASAGLFGLSVFMIWIGVIASAELRPVCLSIGLTLSVWVLLMFLPVRQSFTRARIFRNSR